MSDPGHSHADPRPSWPERAMSGQRLRLWAGGRWFIQETVTLPPGMKISELPAVAAGWGIPDDAEFAAAEPYGGDIEVRLVWLVPAGEDK